MRWYRHVIHLSVFLLFLPLAAGTAMGGEDMREQLHALLGGNDTWALAALGGLKKGMSHEEVRAVFPQLPEAEAATKKIFIAKAAMADNPLVDYHELKFHDGKLYGAIVNFHAKLDRESFKDASLAAFEAKFGRVKAEKRDKDTINKFNSDGQGAQRFWLVDHWVLEVDVP